MCKMYTELKSWTIKIGWIATVWNNIQIENGAMQPILPFKFFKFNLYSSAQCTQLYQVKLKHGHLANLVIYTSGLLPPLSKNLFMTWQLHWKSWSEYCKQPTIMLEIYQRLYISFIIDSHTPYHHFSISHKMAEYGFLIWKIRPQLLFAYACKWPFVETTDLVKWPYFN